MTFNYDVIVVGAGHAGCEAAAAAANLGSKTLLITMDMNKIAQMSCNPAVGGIAKGQIVREIDALGGYMGIVTDQTAIQFRMLNRSKGPAMWSPRAQSDRARFIDCWRGILENMPNLSIWQDMVQELIIEHGQVCGVRTGMNVVFRAGAVVLTNGDLPKRPASYRKNPDTGRTYRRACGDRTYRATYLFRYPNRSHENRNTGPYRWPERSLR